MICTDAQLCGAARMATRGRDGADMDLGLAGKRALVTGSSYGPKIWTDGPGDTPNTRTVTGGADPGGCDRAMLGYDHGGADYDG